METSRTSAHTRFDLKYHFVWITKFRKPLLRGEVGLRLRELVVEVCKAGTTLLEFSLFMGHSDVVKVLLNAGADVHKRDTIRSTALMTTAILGHANIVQVLLDAGADIHAKDKYGKTALKYAIKKGHSDIVDLLKRAGATE